MRYHQERLRMRRIRESTEVGCRVKRSGFTLIELSIVLVVIGLIVGGIVVAQEMIRQSQIRQVIGEITKYNQAFIDFHDKYQSFPGDMPNAESIWGTDTVVGCPGSTTTTPHTTTCNGNGDGQVDIGTEMFRAWQQLADAGMIDGTYTGVSGPGGSSQHLPGVNVPPSAVSGGGYEICFMTNLTGDASTLWYDGYYQNSLAVGAPRSPAGVDNPLFTPTEAYSIDAKIDDGLPATGFVRAWKSSINPNCTTSDISSSATLYNMSYSGIACSFKFVQQF
jgi:prepilin-type N-terminal cleavage/methylation domain-containing protein